MREIRLKLHAYRYLPYERVFAKLEAEALLGVAVRRANGGLVVRNRAVPWSKAERLTYVEGISDGKTTTTTVQARLEKRGRNGHRQNTRYSAHGLHEYKGKFNPQVVRAIGNLLALKNGAWILDPFCGSGTTLLEAAHSGWNAIGLDVNPLAVEITRAKVEAIHADPEQLAREAETLAAKVRALAEGADFSHAWSRSRLTKVGGAGWRATLPNFDYLADWFPISVLAQFAGVLRVIPACVAGERQVIYRVLLSDLVRRASQQDPGDLRIRRRKESFENAPVMVRFADLIEARLPLVTAARQVVSPLGTKQDALLADARRSLSELLDSATPRLRFDAVITSPPYATALPYIDTQRLSLALLGLVKAEGIMPLQRTLTGTREITESARKVVEARIEAGVGAPSATVLKLCRRMHRLAQEEGNGFRRRNMPALIYMYFEDLARVFRNVAEVVHKGACFALVVGPSTTRLGGVTITVDTPSLLIGVAENEGWQRARLLKLDAYARYDLHSRNSIRSESLLLLERT